MLNLVGIGLNNDDLTLQAISILKNSIVYADRYTTFFDNERKEFISNIINKPLIDLNREDLEEKLSIIIERARDANVSIIIGGDPLIATTHKIIFIEAKKRKVPIKVYHATSILSAIIGESGLDFYRFGQICTISKWQSNYMPVSFYEAIERNYKNNLHSLVLLDYDPTKNSSLALKDAVSILDEAEKKYKKGLIKDNTLLFIMHKIALKDQQKLLVNIKEAKKLNFANGPTALIIPANLSDIEKEVIESMY
ncbi:MAG: diphthine synthase [Candidatus Marsarchaeota archaeon]|jgi:diphthine synthase|nr:diphthine synthase [Candidatus Marsarchaeota archaeon]